MSLISMRSYEVSLRAVAFRYLWCVIRSCSPRISGAHECRNEGQSQPKRTFVTSRQYVRWSTCTCVDRNRLLLTDHTSKLMFLSFYSLNIKGYFQSLAYDVWKPKLKVFSLCYLRKSVQIVKIWRELWSTYHAHTSTYPWCHSSLSYMTSVFVLKSANKI